MNAAAIDSPLALRQLARRLKAHRDCDAATHLLWLAAEGRIDALADGRVGFWSKDAALVQLQERAGSRIALERPIRVSLTWPGPVSEAAVWGAIAPEAIESVELDENGEPVVLLREFELQLKVEAEEESIEALAPRPRRRGPARLYPRLARTRNAR